jgi:hypothetical protein
MDACLQVNDEAGEKVLEVERHYMKIRQPIYVQRNSIIQRIKEFWKKALMTHPTLHKNIGPDDAEVLSFLRQVLCLHPWMVLMHPWLHGADAPLH